MNREIKFRGQKWYADLNRLDFVYGYLTDRDVIKDKLGNSHVVWEDSVGQFTGLKDKNGVDIYEGDMVVAWSQGSKGTFQIKWRHTGNPCWLLYPNFLNREHWSISSTENKKGKKFINIDGSITLSQTDGYYDKGLEVIGNIHENKN